MKANTAQRFRLYPDVVQAERLTAWSHTCRAVWNTALAQRIWAFRSAQRATVRGIDQCRELTEARREYGWLRDLPAQCAQQVLRHLDAAYENFWNPDNPAELPRFKKKYHRQAVPFAGQAVQVRRVAEPAEPPINTGSPVGVDVGIACSVFVSDEDQERQRPETLTSDERICLRGLEQRKNRQVRYAKKHNEGRYSNRLRKTIARISALKARQARRRADWNHKLTTYLANSHGLIGVEDLSVRNMIRSARGTIERPGANVRQKAGLNRLIADQGWFEIRRRLEYKTRRCGAVLVAVRAAGTSQTCSKCGVRDPESRQGCARLFACVHCGHSEHADRNAALNIRDQALITAGWAGTTTSGRGGSQSTRSPQRQGTRQGSRMREPSSSVTAERPGGISRIQAGEDVKRG